MHRYAAISAVALGCLLALSPMTVSSAQPPAFPSRSEAMENTRTGRFVQSVVPFAQAEEREYGVPTSVSIAQAILETGWGRSTLNQYGLNYFGIKCTSVVSPYQDGCWNLSTAEYINGQYVNVNAGFRTYATVADSFMDHGRFLRVNDRYASAFNTTNSNDFARTIAAAGYATDPSYAATLINIMQDFNLYRYDLRNADPVTVDQWVNVAGPIGSFYYSDPLFAERLGAPIGGESSGPVPGTTMVVFNRGVIIWSAAYGPNAFFGDIWDTYRRSHNDRNTNLGAPISSTIQNGVLTSVVFERGRLGQPAGNATPTPQPPAASVPPPTAPTQPAATPPKPSIPSGPTLQNPGSKQPSTPAPATPQNSIPDDAEDMDFLRVSAKISSPFPGAIYIGALQVSRVVEPPA